MAETPTNVQFEQFFRGLTLSCDAPATPTDWLDTKAELYLGGVLVASAQGREISFDFPDLTPGSTYSGRMLFVDTSEVESAWADAAADSEPGKVGTEDVEDGFATTVKIAQDAVTALEVLQVSDAVGTTTTSGSFVDITGFEITFVLDDDATALLYMTLYGLTESTTTDFALGIWELNLDGSSVTGSERFLGGAGEPRASDGTLRYNGTVASMAAVELLAGPHTLKGRFRSGSIGLLTGSFDRIIGVQIFKR